MMVEKRESFKFPKRERLTHPQEFRSVMKFGKKIPSRNLILFLKENNSQAHRLGLVVSREVGSAAYRNRIKRFIREYFRHYKNRIRGTLDVVILVRKNCTLQSYRETKEEMGRLVGIV
jgi:ribonuclease P protein component